MDANKALYVSIIISIILVGALAGYVYYEKTVLTQQLNQRFAVIADTFDSVKAQVTVESTSLRDELNQRSDFLLTKILEAEAKSAEEIKKVEQ